MEQQAMMIKVWLSYEGVKVRQMRRTWHKINYSFNIQQFIAIVLDVMVLVVTSCDLEVVQHIIFFRLLNSFNK